MFQDANKFWDKGLCSNRWLRHTLWLCDLRLHCDLHTHLLIFSQHIHSVLTQTSHCCLLRSRFKCIESFSPPSFPIIKPCMSVVNWGIFYKEQIPMHTMSFEKCVWCDHGVTQNTDFFLSLLGSVFRSLYKFHIFSLTLGGYELTLSSY